MALKFVNLHGHDGHSIYDGIGSPEDYAEFMLKNAGEDSGALAITNHGNMNSIGYMVAAQKKYKQKGAPVKFIYGIEAYYIPSLEEWKRVKLSREEGAEESVELVIENEKESKSKYYDPLNRKHHLVLVAMNQQGLENLYRLVTRSYRQGFYRKPRIDLAMLKELNEGIVASTACLHPDSLVQTSVGEISIKEVVDRLKSNEELFVLGFDEQAKKVCFRKILWGDKTRENEKLVKIKLKNGKELKLTKDHKVYTDKGWIEAGSLSKDCKILSFGTPPK